MAADEKTPESVRIGFRLPNALALTRPIREFLSHLLEWQRFERDAIEAIRLVATEVVNNSMEHASDSEVHEIEIDVEIDPKQCILRVRDEGEGRLRQDHFEFEGGPPDHFGDRGRGLFIIKAYSDLVAVREVPSGGTEVEITFYRESE